ncbi:MAG TPA: PIG-L family deacetylase [Burkholderiales bacterium]|nr:PIG-L family deacetylase [Burkholderiales bacterium]
MAFRDIETAAPPAGFADMAGRVPATQSGLIIVSPHLDDGVLSCGMLLAAHPGATLVTVFCGTPPDASTITEWDRNAGFANAGAAMATRCAEDRMAAGILQVRSLHLPFLDAQYGGVADAETLRQALKKILGNETAATVAVPLGLFHSDHRRVHCACLRLRSDFPQRRWIFYEDVPYRCLAGEAQRRLARLRAAGIVLSPLGPAPAATVSMNRRWALKRRAAAAYSSQLRALGVSRCKDVWRQERFWFIEFAQPAPKDGDDAA